MQQMVLQAVFRGEGSQAWELPLMSDRIEISNDGGEALTVNAGGMVIPLIASDTGFSAVIPKFSRVSVTATGQYRIAVYRLMAID